MQLSEDRFDVRPRGRVVATRSLTAFQLHAEAWRIRVRARLSAGRIQRPRPDAPVAEAPPTANVHDE